MIDWVVFGSLQLMRDEKRSHPLRRVREAFHKAPEASGLRKHHTSAGFAKLIGRAASSIRNVESGQTKKWDRLAMRIEDKIGVSADWLLGQPDPRLPILGTDGEPWAPEKFLDYLGGAAGELDWRVLMSKSPEKTVKLAASVVEMKLKNDILGLPEAGETPSHLFLADLVELLDRHQCFENKEVTGLLAEASIQNLSETLGELVAFWKDTK